VHREKLTWAQHIYAPSFKKTLRHQYNIGFCAIDDFQECPYTMRVGIGFYLENSTCPQGVSEYTDFLLNVRANPQGFDTVFDGPGKYAQPTDFLNLAPFSTFAWADTNPNIDEDWRFFGRIYVYDNPAHQQLFHSVDNLVREICKVFDTIRHAGFGPK
jgi:hypothetical protein